MTKVHLRCHGVVDITNGNTGSTIPGLRLYVILIVTFLWEMLETYNLVVLLENKIM